MKTILTLALVLISQIAYALKFGELPATSGIKPEVVLDEHFPNWKHHRHATFAIRGYFSPGGNQRSVWDDLIIVKLGDDLQVFNANVDPTGFKPSRYFNKPLPSLLAGEYEYAFGTHRSKGGASYDALVQVGEIVVKRDDGSIERGNRAKIGINCHPSAKDIRNTGSAGCLTIPSGEIYQRFLGFVQKHLKKGDPIKVILAEAHH